MKERADGEIPVVCRSPSKNVAGGEKEFRLATNRHEMVLARRREKERAKSRATRRPRSSTTIQSASNAALLGEGWAAMGERRVRCRMQETRMDSLCFRSLSPAAARC